MFRSLTYGFLIKGFIITLPFFFLSISTPVGGVTLDRFFVLTTFLSMILLSFRTTVKRNLISFTLLTFVIYLTFNRLLSGDELVSKYFLLITSVLSFYISFKAAKNKVNLNRAINISFILFSIISLYSLWHFLSRGFVPSSFPFLNSIPFIRPVDYEHMELVNLSYTFPRLSLPYPTAPQLSIVMAVYSFYYLTKVLADRKRKYVVFFTLGIIFMFTTISRSGIIPFLLISFLYYSIQVKKNIFIKYNRIIFFAILIIFFLKFFNEDLYTILYERFFATSTQDFTAGHLDARRVGLNLFLEASFIEMLFGVGIGNFPGLHAHMTLLTLLVETGIIGTTMFGFIFFQRMHSTIKFYMKNKQNAQNHMIELMIVLLVFLGMLLYEFTYIFPLYVFMGIACGNSFLEREKLKSKE